MKAYSNLVALISSEFNKYLIEHEDIAEKILPNSLIVFQIEGEDSFNKWSKEVSYRNKGKDQPLIYVNIKKWRQAASVEELDVIMN